MEVSTGHILKAILDHSPQNIVLIDRHHKVICYNERMKQTLFHFHDRFLEVGSDFREFVVNMAMSTYLDAFEKALNGVVTELDLETIAEHYRGWYYYRVNPVYAPNGELLGVSLSAEDITDRKAVQQALTESEDKFRALVEQSLIGVFILLDERFIYVNPAFESILALKSTNHDYTFNDFIHADDADRLMESCRNVIDGKEDKCHLVVNAIRGDGALRRW